MTKLIVLSDIHYRKGEQKIFSKIKKVLERDKFEKVVFLGDTFDFFFEFKGKFYKKENVDLLDFLRDLSKDYELFFIRGNHDIFIGNMFKKVTGCKYVFDDMCLEFDWGKVLLTHGHLLKNDGLLKKFFYFILKNKFDRFLFSLLPESLGYRLGIQVSNLCNLRKMDKNVKMKKIENVKNSFGENFQKIVIGHYHLDFVSDDKRIYILSDFKENGSYIVIDEKGVFFEHF
ncbi:TPA: hypothetical protein DIT23_01225 [candidate division WOR-3 bacterium]|uniref:Metallophosphoesterase n=1 Tax=candidate division TA06 bacterium 34_109 TaxID=1635277 RepID=A0A101I3J2_UNCT6|nr:MAG: Metallophosphoesterase [candidate division TA06 bacterium 34_109]HCP16162.1 hypothetical protein [candidate division WOR-3 bacterium]